jgi:Methyltransferase domain
MPAEPRTWLPLFEYPRKRWRMHLNERAAMEGLLCAIRPKLAVEVGTESGGSLARIVAHSDEVHSFDLVRTPEARAIEGADKVTFHEGDSHELLPRVLREFADDDRNVDFAMIDGDHTADGVRRDVQDVLSSNAVRRSVVLLHDTMNPEVRRGLEEVDYEDSGKVAYVEHDFVAGHLRRTQRFGNYLWGGLGIIVIDATREPGERAPVREQRFVPTFTVLRPLEKGLIARDRGESLASDLWERVRRGRGQTG